MSLPKRRTHPAVCREGTNLLLLDFTACGFSHPHADRTEAWNIALGISQVVGEVVARWLFFHPSVAERASALWQEVGGAPGGFDSNEEQQDKVSRPSAPPAS